MQILRETLRINKISLHTWRAQAASPRAAMVLLHGYGEYADRYEPLVKILVEQGISCYLLDHRGHGRSDGSRGAIRLWEDYLTDLDGFLAQVRQWNEGAPQILFGHSMGGLLAASYAIHRKHDFRFVCLSSPYMGLAAKVNPLMLAAGRLISKVLPGVSMPTELDAKDLTHDQAIVDDYVSDPLVHKVANSRWFTESSKEQSHCIENASALHAEALLMQYGQADSIANPKDAERFFANLTLADKTAIPYPGMYHEIFNEIERERVTNDLLSWLDKHL